MCAVELTAKAVFFCWLSGVTYSSWEGEGAYTRGFDTLNRETGSQHNGIEGNVSLRFGLVWMISS